MAKLIKKFCLILLLAAGVSSAQAFSLYGPYAFAGDAWQTVDMTYTQTPGDLGHPKNLGEEYRWNIPVIFYSMEQSFLEYFGTNGAYAIDQAVSVFSSLTNVSYYSSDLTEFSQETREINYQAQAVHLYDLKTAMMEFVVEELGLAPPDRWTWALRARIPSPTCPNFVYFTIKRNFDPINFEPTSYVNGTLLSYTIVELCPTPNQADAVEFSVDPLATRFGAVAENASGLGVFYSGLTRDDVGGLRYLWRSNNINVESAGAGVLQISTNFNVNPTILTTSNLATFAADALTNDAPTLQAIYPNLVILSTTNYFALQVTTNLVAYFVNLPTSPAGSPATLITFPVYTTNLVTRFVHQFGNVVTNHFYTNGYLTSITVTTNNCQYAPVGSPCPPVTNAFTVKTPMITGDYYIIPTNSCGVSIISVLWSNVVATTNIVVATNAPGVTNLNGQQFSQTTVTYFTNFQYAVRPVQCFSNSVALRQGMEKIRFVRRDYDSEFGQFFYPTNLSYTGVAVTNNAPVVQLFQKLTVFPDMLISASDTGNAIGARPVNNFNTANALPGLAGPGTVPLPVVVDFNKVGPIYLNVNPGFINEDHPGQLIFQWGSFDGTTNAPILYPSGRSMVALENQIFIQILPDAPVANGAVQLPNANVGVNYTLAFGGFSGSGGLPPYLWGVSPDSVGGLPPGLTLNANGTITGSPSAGTGGLTYDFLVRMTDSAARFVDRPYAITINP